MLDPQIDSRSSVQEGGGGPDGVPWYRSTKAYFLYGVLAFLLVVAALVRWRTAYLEQQRHTLEAMVSDRTAKIRKQALELEAYNRELIQLNESLRQTSEEKARLLGMAAHDLKNPLFGIRALAEILLEKEEMSDGGRRKLTLIQESADETLHLIEDLLSSAASAARDIDPEPVDVARLAAWVVESFRPQEERKQQEIRCSLPEAPCVVEGDERMLREAMNNLISNALKYSPPGETVAVSVDRSNGTVRFSVADEGPGLSEQDQKRLFAPFQRLTPKPTGEEGSSGLGLYIVKRIATLHDGDVEVETELGDGSTFSLVLPAASSAASSVPKKEPCSREEVAGIET